MNEKYCTYFMRRVIMYNRKMLPTHIIRTRENEKYRAQLARPSVAIYRSRICSCSFAVEYIATYAAAAECMNIRVPRPSSVKMNVNFFEMIEREELYRSALRAPDT